MKIQLNRTGGRAACFLLLIALLLGSPAHGAAGDSGQSAPAEPAENPGDSVQPAADDRESEAPADAADLPSPEALLDRAIEAMGGAEAFDAIESMRTRSVVRSRIGEITVETHAANGGRFLIEHSSQRMGEVRMGSDGSVAWAFNERTGYDLFEPDDHGAVLRQASVHRIIHWLKKDAEELTTLERTAFDDVECHKVRSVNVHGIEQFLYLRTEDGRLSAIETTQEREHFKVRITMRFEEWRDVGDLTLFHRIRISQPTSESHIEFTEIELDAVDESVFELPEEVRRLAERRAEEEAEAEEPGEE